MLFPSTIRDGVLETTCLALEHIDAGDSSALPAVLGVFAAADAAGFAVLDTPPVPLVNSRTVASPSLRLSSLLNEVSRGSFARPGLRGYRAMESSRGDGSVGAANGGVDWSPKFVVEAIETVPAGTENNERLAIIAQDASAGLGLRTEIESLPGGSLRIRHRLTNCSAGAYVVEALEVRIPLRDDQTEILDFAGRHERERTPQRHEVADGTWLHESRRGKPWYDGNLVVAGTPGFGFGTGSIVAVQPAWSGNTVVAVDRTSEDDAAICAGELLLPGEVMLDEGETYETPWIMVTASEHGLDGVAHSLHAWQRTLAAHPATQPVTLNVWEAVYMDQDFGVLSDIARRAANLGVERYVLDDGWFHLRRTDHAGLGDWWVDPEVWPEGLGPLIDLVHGLGMEFGLWFEPEMVNPDSDLFRAHPDWVMQASERLPMEHRHQQVLDLTNPEAFRHVFEAISTVLAQYPIDYVKWDHNRDLLEAGTNQRNGSPSAHEQTRAFYALLDALRERFPKVVWESCASGGGRIDMGVIEHVSRVWTSDMTDALSRQQIQRWTVQNVAPEYMGAHVSATTSHQTHRTLPLAFRAATAVFFGFGIEWNIRQASDEDLEQLRQWIDWYKKERGFLHSGLFTRLDMADPEVFAYGVVAADGSRALLAHVQIDESTSNRGTWLRVRGLDTTASYRLRWAGPETPEAPIERFDPAGPIGGRTITGALLERRGVWIPRCRPQTIRLIDIVRC